MVSKNPIHTGDSEGFGITSLDADACGKPVIGSNYGGIPDAVAHNVSGMLVEPDSVEQTAEAIVNLLSQDDLRKQLGRHGRKRVEDQFTWDHVASKIYDITNLSSADIEQSGVD
ncbi:glycosyltransferase [Candidatus Neomarinimicrobiota bacterium]